MFVVHVFEIALGCRPTNDFELVIDGIGNGKTTVRFDASVEVLVTAVNEFDVGLRTCRHFVTDLS